MWATACHLALTNALGMPIFIISTMLSHPLFVLTPRKPRIFFPVFAAFNHHSCGHYYAIAYTPALQPSLAVASPSFVQKQGCTCGRGDKSVSNHCVVKQFKYTTIIVYYSLFMQEL